MEIISKLYEKCEKCPYVNECDEKRMMACGIMERPEPLAQPAANVSTMPIAAEMLVKHDYRNIKISPTETITVDLEKLKKEMEQQIYKALGCPGLEYGA